MMEKEKRDLVIGFDFGTAATKVIVRDPSLRRAHAISFQEYGHSSNSYLLPSELTLNKKGKFMLKCHDPAITFRHIKVLLLDGLSTKILVEGEKIEIKPLQLAAIYIALALKQVRERFLKMNREVYRHLEPIWQLNIGIPAKNYDMVGVRENFLKAAKLGWWLSRREQISLSVLDDLNSLKINAEFEFGLHADHLNVIPEIAAQVAGYAKSRARDEGLHILIDIGATTVDIASFRLYANEGEDSYAFMTADVSRYGCYELHVWRSEKIRDFLPQWQKQMGCTSDMVEAIPEELEKYCPKPTDIPLFDEEFMDILKERLAQVVVKTKRERDPNASEWETGLPLFICGGGSNMKIYKDSLIRSTKESITNWIWRGFRKREIPRPEIFSSEALKSSEYHRLSVAYGLSYPEYEIGHIIPEREIEDIKIQKSGKVYEYISKDMV